MRGGGGVGHSDSDRVTGSATVHSLHGSRGRREERGGGDGGGGRGRGTGSSNNDAAAAKAKRGTDGADLCSHEAVQETAEERKLYATERTQRRSEQAGSGGRAGNGGTNGGRAVRLARRQATETAAREHGGRRRGEAAEATRPGQRRRTTTTIARKRTPSRYSNPTVHTYHRESPRSSNARGAVGFHPTGRGEARPSGRKAEPEHLETRVWGVSGPVRIQEQNRTTGRRAAWCPGNLCGNPLLGRPGETA